MSFIAIIVQYPLSPPLIDIQAFGKIQKMTGYQVNT
jgi:hypothetical protein